MSVQTEGLAWYALRVPSQRETMAAKILRHDGLVAEVPVEPRMRKATKWDRERRERFYPSMPGYIMFASPAHEPPAWRRVFRLHLIRSVVSIEGRPAVLDTEAVGRVLRHQWESQPAYAKWQRTGKEFAPGDTVFIAEGPFRDFELRVQDIQEGEAVFLVPMLGKVQEIRVKVDDCAKAA